MRTLLALLLTALLTACGSTREWKEPDKLYRAYGGMRNAYRETHVVTSSSGKRISVPGTLYALQRDGTFKKIVCCEYFREKGDLYNIDDKLVFVFDNARRCITDCFIHPAGRPDNEFEPDSGKRILGVTVFAEFDPKDGVFKVATFDAGDYAEDEYWAFEREKGYMKGRMPIAETMAFLYSKRKAFMCDDPRAVPQKDDR